MYLGPQLTPILLHVGAYDCFKFVPNYLLYTFTLTDHTNTTTMDHYLLVHAPVSRKNPTMHPLEPSADHAQPSAQFTGRGKTTIERGASLPSTCMSEVRVPVTLSKSLVYHNR